MLNKLLKRCMPWMDKGRWYHVRLENANGTILSEFDDLFTGINATDDKIAISFDPDKRLNLIDWHATIETISPDMLPGIRVLNTILAQPIITNDDDYSSILVNSMPPSMTINYWFFIKTL